MRDWVLMEEGPYMQGFDAAHYGKMVADCPYEYNTPEGAEWLAGYQDGGGDE
jgi:ribosome modulation factor